MEFKYDAFISYRHHEVDTAVARYVQHWLEHFHVPGPIRRETGKDKIDRIFRDSEELPLTFNIGDDIKHALKNSEFLIVICSPRTDESVWVKREITEFLTTHDVSHVLTVIAEGEPYDVIPERLTWTEQEVEDANGNPTTVRLPLEPLSSDLRLPRHQASRTEMPRLAASILGCPYDSLVQRTHRYHRKIAGAISLAVMLAMTVSTLYIWRSNVLITRNYQQALSNQSEYLASESEKALKNGDRMTAIRLAIEALPSADSERPYTARAEKALLSALPAYISESYASSSMLPDASYLLETSVTDLCVSDSGKWLAALDASGMITVWNAQDNAKSGTIVLGEDSSSLSPDLDIQLFTGDDKLIFTTKDSVYCCEVPSCSILWKTKVRSSSGRSAPGVQPLHEEDRLLVSNGDTGLCLLSLSDGSIEKTFTLEALDGEYSFIRKTRMYSISSMLDISPDDRYAAFSAEVISTDEESQSSWSGYTVGILDLEKGTFLCLQAESTRILTLGFAGNDRLILNCRTPDSSGSMYMLGGTTMYHSQNEYTAWDPASGKLLWKTEGASVQNYLYSALFCTEIQKEDGTAADAVVLIYSNIACFLDLKTGDILKTIETPGSVLSAMIEDDSQLILATDTGSYVTAPLDSSDGWTAVQTPETALSDCILGEDLIWTVTGNSSESDPAVLKYSRRVTDNNWTPIDSGTILSYEEDHLVAEDAIVLTGPEGLLISDGQGDSPLRQVSIPEEYTYLADCRCGLTEDHLKTVVYSPYSSAAYAVTVSDGSMEALHFAASEKGNILDCVFLKDCFWYLRTESKADGSDAAQMFFGISPLGGSAEEIPVVSLDEPGNCRCVISNGTAGSAALVIAADQTEGSCRAYLIDAAEKTAVETEALVPYLVQSSAYDPSDCICWNEDESRFALLSGDSVITFDRSGSVLSVLKGSGSPVMSASFSQDGTLLTISDDSILRKYDAEQQLQWTVQLDTASAYFGDYEWTYLPDGFLLLNAALQMNVIDLENELAMTAVENCYGYQEGSRRFVCLDSSGYGFRDRYTLETLIAKGWETLGSFEMPDQMKTSYGLNDGTGILSEETGAALPG